MREPSRFFASTCFLGLLLTAAVFGQDHFVAFPPNVFRISPANQIEIVTLPKQREYRGTQFGGTMPKVSPNHLWITFTRGLDLWLYNTRTGEVSRATHLAQPYSRKFASVEVLTVRWSSDSSQLLVNLVPGETECVDCENRGDWQQRKANYGYLVYSLKNRNLRRVTLPANFEVAAWLTDDRLWGMNAMDSSGRILTATFTGKAHTITNINHVTQMEVSADGNQLLVTINEKKDPNDKESSSYIARVNLIDGQVTKLTSAENFAEFQSPRLSPDKNQAAWVQQFPSVIATPHPQATSKIIVEGRSILECPSPFLPFAWIDGNRIAAYCGQKVVVVDSTTGKQLGSMPIPEEAK